MLLLNHPSKTLQVAAAVIEKEGSFLITKRLKRSHLGHCWEFPGGKLERGETLEECVIRECKEELNISVKPLHKIQELVHHYPEVSVHLHFFLCDHLSGEPQAIECADFSWVTPSDLTQYEFPEADRAIINQLQMSSFQPHT